MKKSNEFSTVPQSSEAPSAQPGAAPTVMYLIEVDPNVRPCLLGGSLPLQMLNVNENNSHFLIPIQGSDQLWMPDLVSSSDATNISDSISLDTSTVVAPAKAQTVPAVTRKPHPKLPKANHSNWTAELESVTRVSSLVKGVVSTSCSQLPTSAREPLAPPEWPDLSAAPPDEEEEQADNYLRVADSAPPPRAQWSLPGALRRGRAGVAPRQALPPRVAFGPVRGVVRNVSREEADDLVAKAAASSTPVFLVTNGDQVCHIDVSDPEQANWLGRLPLGARAGAGAANVWLRQRGARLLAESAAPLRPRTALRLGYSAHYARAHRLPAGLPVRPEGADDIREEEQPPPGARRAADLCCAFQEPPPRRRYRCKHCAMHFARLFTLKRHVSLHCKALLQMEMPTNFDVARPAAVPPAPPTPSPAGLTHPAASTPGFQHSEIWSDPIENHFEKKPPKAASPCPHCEQLVPSSGKHRHNRQCPARQLSCGCGRRFRSRERLAQHVRDEHDEHEDGHDEHENGLDEHENGNDAPVALQGGSIADDSLYACEQCQSTFKRRGMLVNHSWRVHGVRARVPLRAARRVYPCAACPRRYRSAAKRDQHHRAHHPGAEALSRAVIVCARELRAGAACPACPRQYASRAKALQHLRRHHPHLAPPVKKKR